MLHETAGANMRESELLRMLQTAPHQGIKMIMDTYTGLVYTIISNRLTAHLTKSDIEECISDTFLRLYNSREKIDLKKGSLKSYLCVIAKNQSVDMLRRKNARGEEICFDELPDCDRLAYCFCGEEELEKEEERAALLSAIQNLGEPDREIIIRRYYLMESSKSVAERLSLSENAVNLRVYRALKKLKRSLGGVDHGQKSD